MRRGDERGDSLAEILMAITVFGIAGIALIQGLFTLSFGAGSGKRLGSAQTVLVTAAETIAAVPYENCATAYPVEPGGGYQRPQGWSGSISVTYEYWNGTAFTQTCDEAAIVAAPFDALRLQRITVTVNTISSPARSIAVLKRGTT